MDKFGIFNIINSLLGGKTSASDNETTQSPNLNNLLSALTTPKPQSEKPTNTTLTPPLPLQTSMISTMNGHDEFIKRVMEKNKTKT